MKRQNKGITLVALVITIIILLILAGIAINSLTNSGLLTKAGEAAKLSKLKEIEEFAQISYMTRQLDEITEGKEATIAGVISDLKEKGYTIKEIAGGTNSITGIALSEENITMERNTEKTVTYTFVYSDGTLVRYFVEVDGKDYEITFNNGEIKVNTNETNLGEISKEPEVTVTSSNSNIIEVNKTEDGKIVLRAKNELGDVTITLKETNSNVTKTFSVKISIPATGITVMPKTETIKPGGTVQLIASLMPSDTTDSLDEVTWSSSNESVATVSNSGLVTGIEEGQATITVKHKNGLTNTCEITVSMFIGINPNETNPKGAMPSGNVTVIESDASKGIVIKDKNDREWVWIEVPKTIFTTADALGEGKTAEELNAAIKADLIAYAGVYRKGATNQNYNYSDTWYSGCGVSDATTYNTMYNKMINSIYNNGGFWIQRYEDGTTNITCGNAQVKASGYAPDESKTSSLLFGIQWDLVCRYLDGKEGLTTAMINTNSSSWGRYNDTSGNKPQAGLERNKKMNIYDFAGNLYEWTLECGNNYPCIHRGGGYNITGSDCPASYRDIHTTSQAFTIVSFRSTFY